MSHHSIAETCFFVPPGHARGSRKRKRAHVDHQRSDQAFKHSVESLDHDVADILNTEHSALLESVLATVRSPLTAGQLGKLKCSLIISGGDTNTDRLYTRITTALGKTPQCTVVNLDAADCTNLKSALKSIVQATITSGRPIQNRSKVQNHDMRLIAAWHAHQDLPQGQKRTIILAMPHIERFQTVLVNQLVDVLSLYDLDFRLLCSISSALNQIQDVFLTRTIRKLHFTRFEVDSQESTLDKVVLKQLIEHAHSLRLGFEAYNAIWTDYHHSNRSVDLVVSALKYTRLCHYYTNPLAFTEDSGTQNLDKRQCDFIRGLPSFRQFVRNCEAGSFETAKRVRLAITDDASLLDLVNTFLASIRQYKRELSHALKCFFFLKDDSQASVKTKTVAELYKILLKEGLRDSNAAKELLMSVKVMRKETLSNILQACETITMDENQKTPFRSFLEELDFITQMPDTASVVKSAEELRLSIGWKDSRPTTPAKRELKTEHEQISNRATRETLASRKSAVEATRMSLTEKEKRFTALVDSIHAHFTKLFDHLINHEHLPLHELFWFNFDKNHKAAFSPNIRLHLRSALSDHETFLGKTEIEPHTSALFRLFQDGGQLINLYDWFQAFKQVYSPNLVVSNQEDDEQDAAGREEEGQGSDEDDGDEEKAKLQQALFVRSVAELKFLGFFKSTKRKTDHVQKTISIL